MRSSSHVLLHMATPEVDPLITESWLSYRFFIKQLIPLQMRSKNASGCTKGCQERMTVSLGWYSLVITRLSGPGHLDLQLWMVPSCESVRLTVLPWRRTNQSSEHQSLIK